ncbi:hypothetical protein SmJEL517_g00017 [Synchytrium microbalum]|uniref:Endo-beta-1,6-galactanase-like domain-containing protein n=1 Tax=Synchytrium microbalum TaxID=1806994 RepID=A0A507CFU0_9FUNG|nr:uncharacterized protein SmJEL517_g00017 [Synchytrium microbalum]TPX38228.1 hypothetical protein SmJEL517_g00017 [Synchytrium microbalum]
MVSKEVFLNAGLNNWGVQSIKSDADKASIRNQKARTWKTRVLLPILILGVLGSVGLTTGIVLYKRSLASSPDTIQPDSSNTTIPASAPTATITPNTTLPNITTPANTTNTTQPPIYISPFVVLNYSNAVVIPANLVAGTTNSVNGADWLGFGTSLSWWARWIGDHYYGLSKFDRVMDQLFNVTSGLGLTVVRYNLGATNPPGPSSYTNIVDMPAVQSSANAPFNWTVDQGQRRVLLAAIQKGVQTTELFASSPPQWMTISGVSCGAQGYGNNLATSQFQSYANYIVQTLLYYKDTWNISIYSVAPFSEPTSNWWGLPNWCNQEGCHFDAGQLGPMMNTLTNTIASNGLNTIVAGSDEVDYAVAGSVLNGMSQTDLNSFQRINVHGYFDPTAAVRKSFAAVAQSVNKKVWMSELGTAGENMLPVTYGIRNIGAIGLARNIIGDIYFIGVTAWVYWQAIDQGDWGFIVTTSGVLDPDIAYIGKQYFVMMQFSRWLRPGMDLIRVEQGDTPAVLVGRSVANRQIVIVAMNQNNANTSYSVDISGYAYGLNATLRTADVSMAVYRTSDSEDHALVPLSASFGYGSNAVVLLANCPPNTVTTVILYGLTWVA